MTEARYGTRRTGRPDTARLLLLVLVVLAFAWMHTLGHHSAGHETPAHTPAAAPAAAPEARAHVPAEAMTGHGTADAPPAAPPRLVAAAYAPPTALAAVLGAPGHDPAWTPMCLAVLAAAAALAAAVLLTARARRGTGATESAAVPATAGRGPPRHRPFALLYADLTVLRI